MLSKIIIIIHIIDINAIINNRIDDFIRIKININGITNNPKNNVAIPNSSVVNTKYFVIVANTNNIIPIIKNNIPSGPSFPNDVTNNTRNLTTINPSLIIGTSESASNKGSSQSFNIPNNGSNNPDITAPNINFSLVSFLFLSLPFLIFSLNSSNKLKSPHPQKSRTLSKNKKLHSSLKKSLIEVYKIF